MTIITNIFCTLITYILDKLEEKRSCIEVKEYKKFRYILIALGLIIVWMPQFLAAFPGYFSYDASEIWKQYINNEFRAQYPALYSIILVNIIKYSLNIFENINMGIAFYVLVQMLITAIIFSYSFYILDKYKISKKIKIFGFIYYAICPAIYLYVLAFTKDSLFTIFLYLSLLLYIELFKDTKEFFCSKKWIVLIISDILVILLRRNSIYVYLVFYIILLIKLFFKSDKKTKIKMTSMIIIILIMSNFLNNTLMELLNIKKENSVNAMLSVPVMQIAYVHKHFPDSLTEEEKNKIYEIAPKHVFDGYEKETSDSILYYSNTEYVVNNKIEFFKLWKDIGKRNISSYLNAFIDLYYGYFYPPAVQKVYLGNDSYENREFVRLWFVMGVIQTEHNNPIIQFIQDINIIISAGYMQEIPIIRAFFSIGVVIWILFFAINYCIYKKRYLFVYPSIIILLLLGTYLFAALVMLRYVLIVFYAIPLIMAVILNNERFS